MSLLREECPRKLQLPRDLHQVSFYTGCNRRETVQVYEFLLDAEDQRITLLNEEKVKNLKETTIENATEAFNNNPTLLSKWLSCFPPDVIDSKKVK